MKHLVCTVMFGVLGLASIGPAAAASYYVNSNGGKDIYSGTAATATSATVGPWQTLTKLASVTLAPGDSVFLACGGVWKETLQLKSSGTAQAPITVSAGPGQCSTLPLIDGAITIPPRAWTQHNGSIYRTQLPIDLINNPSQSPSVAGWASWSATGDSSMVVDSACPGQTVPCLAFTSGTSNSIAISNNFALAGGVDYTAGVQVRAPLGTPIKVVLRRGGPTFERLAPDQWVTAAGAWQSVGFIFRASDSVPNARLDIEVPATRIRVNVREPHLRPSSIVGDVLATLVDGLQIRRAHHPNFGQAGNVNSPYGAVASAGGKTTLDTTGLTLPSGAALTPGLGVTIRTVDWAIEARTVAAVAGSRLTLSAPSYSSIHAGYGFFLTGALWMLDSPGEWFYDVATSILYVWMPDSAAPGNRVAASSVAWGVDLSGKSNVALRNIAVRNVGTGVALTRSTAVTLAGATISDVADFGISAENCVRCSVQGSSIVRTGLDAVSVPGAMATGFSLSDSRISESGASVRTDGWRSLPRPAYGAVYSVGPATSIVRNSFIGAAKLGIYAGAMSTIEANYVGQTCLMLNDCGAIYVGRVGSNANIKGNVVENVPGNITGLPGTPELRTVGIYLDDLNANSVVNGNTVTGAEYGIQVHNAHGATISNNVLFGNRRMQLWMQEQTRLVRTSGDVFDNNIVSNLLVPTASGPAIYLDSEIGDTTDFATFSNNHYSGLLSLRVIGERTPTSGNSFSVAEWQAAGRETDARSTQPVGYATFLAGAANLVPNGNLANGMAGWTWWNQTAPKASAQLLNCGVAPCIQMRAGASLSLLTSPNFSVTAGQWYRVTFDAATSQAGQSISAVVRRGGGGSASYEFLMPTAAAFAGSTAWRRYSFTFQATKTVIAGNPVTQELGARVDFEHNLPGTSLNVARLEMVTLTPAQAAVQIKMLLNPSSSAVSLDCASLRVPDAACSSFIHMETDIPISWPTMTNQRSGTPIYTRDTSLADTDLDGIADQQDVCPNTAVGMAVNSRGCALNQ